MDTLDPIDALMLTGELVSSPMHVAALLIMTPPPGEDARTCVDRMHQESLTATEEIDRISLEMYQKMPRPRYFFEPGGRVCFAQFYQERRRWYQFPTGGPVFTRVPCTRAVLDSLENKSSVPSDFLPEEDKRAEQGEKAAPFEKGGGERL